MATTQQERPASPCIECKKPEMHIDDCYNTIIQALSSAGAIQDVSTKLASCTTNYQRLVYVYSILKKQGIFPDIVKNLKDNVTAQYYRCEGNKYFKQKRNYEALQCYNLSILYAEPLEENMVLAVSNRSAVLYDMAKYEECLEDIKFVFNTAFPENIHAKLLDRQRKCDEKLILIKSTKPEDPINSIIADLIRLKGSKDKKYVSASTKLKVMYTNEMGRHVIANEDIEVGEVLVQEDPYLSVLLKKQYLLCCAYCLSRKFNLYPCLGCTYAMYCSIECRDSAYKQYHCYECPMLSGLLTLQLSKMDMLAIRIVIKSLTDNNNKLTDTIKVGEAAESTVNTDVWGCVKVDNEWIYDSKYYSSIHTLATNVEKRSVSDMFRKTLTAAVLFRFLAMVGLIKNNDNSTLQAGKQYVANALLNHLMTSPTNMHSISTNMENEDGNYVDELDIACGAYAFLSLINHSCAPNVVRYSKLGTSQMSLIAIRPIKKGMQIFDNYGYHHAVHDIKHRHTNLQFQYKFTCLCEACVNDWPLYENLKNALDLPAEVLKRKEKVLPSEVLEKLMKADRETAVKCFKPVCELITLLDPYAPCKELAECIEALKQCLAIFHGVVPYFKEVPWQVAPPCHARGKPHQKACIKGAIDFDEHMENY